MTYIFECDGWCEDIETEGPPALTGEFSERWFKTSPHADALKALGFGPGDLVTLCGPCTRRLLADEP
jgi:hypothetical protein